MRRAMDLQFQALGEDFQLHSPREGVLYKGEALSDTKLTEFLVSLNDWETDHIVADRLARLTRISAEAAQAEVLRLVKARILASDEDPEQIDTFAAAPMWNTYGWKDAFTYQVLSDSVKRIDYRTPEGMQQDIAMMKAYLAEAEPPPLYINVSDETFPLPSPRKQLNTTLHEALLGVDIHDRESTPMAVDDLSTFLWFSLGQIGTKKTPASGDMVRRTSPSGGSRHPTEAYILILDSVEVPTGIYHYSVRDHALEIISRQVDIEWVARHVVGKPEWMSICPTVAVILTSCVERSMFRYRENYSYRPIHHDVGHIIETSSLTAKALGRKFFRGFSMNDREVSLVLGTPRLTQPAMAFMLLG